jgi:hypothetical protein
MGDLSARAVALYFLVSIKMGCNSNRNQSDKGCLQYILIIALFESSKIPVDYCGHNEGINYY